MGIIGKIVLYIIMACCGIGAVATIVKEDSGLAQSFNDGLNAMASLFLPIVGLMVSVRTLLSALKRYSVNFFRFTAETEANVEPEVA